MKKYIVTIVLLGGLLYLGSLGNNFAGDDREQIVRNTLVHSIGNIPKIFSGSSFYDGGQLTGIYYKPLMLSFYALIYTFFGANPFYYHLVSLILHISNSVLLFLVLKRFFSKNASFFLSLIFLTHPINSQVVLYVSSLQDVSFFFFGLLAFWLIQTNRPKNMSIPLSSLLLLLSLLSKESGLLFFPIIIFYKLLFNRKFVFKTLIYQVVTFGIYLFLRINAIGFTAQNQANVPIAKLNLLERLINIPSIIIFYLKTFIYPSQLAISWQWVIKNVNLLNFWIPLAVVLVLIISTILIALKIKATKPKIFKPYIFFLGWFFLGLGLHLQILPIDGTVAERWFYFPIVGLLGILGATYQGIFKDKLQSYFNKRGLKFVFFLFLASLIFVLSLRSFIRSKDWKDEITLYTHDVLVSQDAFDLESILGYIYSSQGKLDLAKMHTVKSVNLFPNIVNLNNLGVIYLKEGDIKEAEQAFKRSIEIGDYYLSYQNLSVLMTVHGDPQEAKQFTTNAIEKYPRNVALWIYLGVIEYKLENLDRAKSAILKAYSLDKNEEILSIYRSLEKNKLPEIDFGF